MEEAEFDQETIDQALALQLAHQQCEAEAQHTPVMIDGVDDEAAFAYLQFAFLDALAAIRKLNAPITLPDRKMHDSILALGVSIGIQYEKNRHTKE